MDTSKERLDRLNSLCWEGFHKVIIHSRKEYPTDSQNASLDRFIKEYEGDWEDKINKVTK